MITRSTLFENDRLAIKVTGDIVRILDLHGNQFAIYRQDGAGWNRLDLPSTFPAPSSFETLNDLGIQFLGKGLDLEK